ncbi:hypothetical protein [Calidithermus chliarophilus]|uniref:hypothetical protein n=1 Tax=Calidithermus chliarophilus TaxID=52023 RepID=UPI00157B492C|nr:hypothetical protein [Calidithermus chliarophilus]
MMSGISSSTMKKNALLLLVASTLVLTAGRFSSFSVESGEQELDLGTGVTTMPKGGVLVDNRNGLRLEGSYIQFKQEEFIRARNATLRGSDGNFAAASLEYVFRGEQLRLSGVRYSSSAVKGLTSNSGLGLLAENVVVLKGNVRSQDPQLEASTLVIDTARNQALVLGGFSYKDGQSSFKGQRDDSTLLIEFKSKTTATTKVPADVLGRLRSYANKL